MKTILLSLLSFCTGLFAQEPDTYAYVTLPAETFLARLEADPSIQLVDVRTVAEYTEGHIPGSLNINVLDEQFAANVDELLDKNHSVAVYCKSGRRSRNAARILTKKGFHVVNLDKGFENWKELDKPIEK